MINKIKSLYLKHKEVILYLIMGVLATIVNLGVKYLLLFTILDASKALELQIAIIISWIATVLFAYFTNRVLVFQSKNNNKLKEFLSFLAARIFTLLLEMLIMWFFVTFLKMNSNLWVIVWTIVAQAVVIIANYIFSKLFIFKK